MCVCDCGDLVTVCTRMFALFGFVCASHLQQRAAPCDGHMPAPCATNRSLSRHEPACCLFSLLGPLPPHRAHSLPLSPPPPSPLLSPSYTLRFPSSLPLPPSLGSAPKQPGVGAKAQAVPCRAHMDSGVLLSRARHVVPARRLSSRLTSRSATATTVPPCRAVQQAADNVIATNHGSTKGCFECLFVYVRGRRGQARRIGRLVLGPVCVS